MDNQPDKATTAREIIAHIMQIDPERLTAVNPTLLYTQLTKLGYHYDATANAWGVTIDPRIKNKLTNDSGTPR